MAYQDVTIYDPSGTSPVFDGEEIDLQVISMDYDFSVFNAVEPVPGTNTTGSWNSRLAYGDHVGFDNPLITIHGVIDVTDTTPSSPSANSPVTMKLLLQLIKSGNELVLSSVYDDTKDVDEGKYRMYSLDSSDNETTFTVVPKSLKIEDSADRSKEGKLMFYTLTLQEVRS